MKAVRFISGFPKRKRGVSEILGYILLMSIVIAISIGVYAFLRTYVPQQSLSCPSGVSVSLASYTYNCTTNRLNFSLENSGTFNIAGYYIHATNSSTQQTAVIDLSSYLMISTYANVFGNSVLFSGGYNVLVPGKTESSDVNAFIIPSSVGNISILEIIPMRIVSYNGQNNVPAICTNSRIDVPLRCS